MLRFAHPYADRIAPMIAREFDAGRLTHYLASGYFDLSEMPTDDWGEIARVSVDEGAGDDSGDEAVLGFLSASVFRHGRAVTNMQAVRFGEPSATFTADLFGFLRLLFETHGMNRVGWTCCVGNPAQRGYEIAVERYGGRVVGITRDSAVLCDGSVSDEVLYEVLRADYQAARSASGGHRRAD